MCNIANIRLPQAMGTSFPVSVSVSVSVQLRLIVSGINSNEQTIRSKSKRLREHLLPPLKITERSETSAPKYKLCNNAFCTL